MPHNLIRAGVCAAALAMSLTAASSVQSAAPAARPPPTRDYKNAPAGKYTVDPTHTGIVARVPHQGFSYSVFRFTVVTGTLEWNPAAPASTTLSVSVDPKSITTPVPNFGAEIAGDRFLKSDKFAAATFVSKAFRPTDMNHGKVDGDFTMMGVTKPVTFDVEMVGTGVGFRGPVIGVAARGMIDPKDYGLTAIPAPIELLIDVEFDKTPG
ncbi:MAG: YceI family protein [Caulobacteraceae bacterium]